MKNCDDIPDEKRRCRACGRIMYAYRNRTTGRVFFACGNCGAEKTVTLGTSVFKVIRKLKES